MKGEVLSAIYAYGSCRLAEKLELSAILNRIFNGDFEFKENYLKELRNRLKSLRFYPVLHNIAHLNGFFDPFDEQVCRAYWTGGKFLKDLKMHHNFCVLKDPSICSMHFGYNVMAILISTCRISTGIARMIRGFDLDVETTSLGYRGKFFESKPHVIPVKTGLFRNTKEGDLISFHMGIAREVISENQKNQLEEINRRVIEFLNNPRRS